jgi:hypothetical protein
MVLPSPWGNEVPTQQGNGIPERTFMEVMMNTTPKNQGVLDALFEAMVLAEWDRISDGSVVWGAVETNPEVYRFAFTFQQMEILSRLLGNNAAPIWMIDFPDCRETVGEVVKKRAPSRNRMFVMGLKLQGVGRWKKVHKKKHQNGSAAC